jgi:hypothetical protein
MALGIASCFGNVFDGLPRIHQASTDPNKDPMIVAGPQATLVQSRRAQSLMTLRPRICAHDADVSSTVTK